VEVFRELLKHGAEVESADKYGWTPLESGVLNGHVEVVRELLNIALKWKVQIKVLGHLSN